MLPKTDAEQLYILQQAIVHAEHLAPFCNPTTIGQCTILGLEHLHMAISSRATCDINEQRQQYSNTLHRYNLSFGIKAINMWCRRHCS